MPLPPHERWLLRGQPQDASTLPSLAQWLPVAIDEQPVAGGDDAPQLWWRWLGQQRLSGAFFQDDLALQPPHERRVCHTPLLASGAWADPADAVFPTAFVFHVSRCGSTLLTQMLNTLERAIVLSEPPVLDGFFRLHHRDPHRSGGIDVFRRLVAALGQRRRGDEQHLWIKLDCWHLPWAAWLRQAYPSVPLVLLYRAPQAVLASHQRQRGLHMVPGLVDTAKLRINTTGVAAGDLDGYGARVLDALFASACQAVRDVPDLRLWHLNQFPDAVVHELLPWVGVPITPAEVAVMQQRARFHSKHGHAVFAGDAPPAPLVGTSKTKVDGRIAVECYQHLEAQRLRNTHGQRPNSGWPSPGACGGPLGRS